ncbi:hypothetical protein CBOM_07078 [Ceraceosorus bombacis]|uniref:Uncharacterized protein n=1 Tax=Ceraceosorus bombacis TaxID=401625 RepID=A0A0P1B7V6_9BASI|nr:hypothetical protein CBOM_07078 [Ceraceosorus bombacis]
MGKEEPQGAERISVGLRQQSKAGGPHPVSWAKQHMEHLRLIAADQKEKTLEAKVYLMVATTTATRHLSSLSGARRCLT